MDKTRRGQAEVLIKQPPDARPGILFRRAMVEPVVTAHCCADESPKGRSDRVRLYVFQSNSIVHELSIRLAAGTRLDRTPVRSGTLKDLKPDPVQAAPSGHPEAGKALCDAEHAAKGADWKVAIAGRLRQSVAAPYRWLAATLKMGHPGSVRGLVSRQNHRSAD